jgi:ribosomal protein S18 acetylase RimI-like enzyme
MELVRVDSGSPYFHDLWELYESAFPPDERRDEERQALAFKKKEFTMFAALDEKKFVGLLSAWEFAGFVFMEHFAVREQLRSRGFGTQIIRTYLSGCRKKVILEVERPDNELRKRRVAFYERIGFTLNAPDYIQPSYGPGKKPVHLLLMSYPLPISEKEYPLLRREIHVAVYGMKEPLV